jgi:hypothetical protein
VRWYAERIHGLCQVVETRPLFPAFLDDIANLQDPEMFPAIIEAEWAARKPAKNAKQEPTPTATAMAKVVATK